jgi:hypothetical protein
MSSGTDFSMTNSHWNGKDMCDTKRVTVRGECVVRLSSLGSQNWVVALFTRQDRQLQGIEDLRIGLVQLL